jgi:hypothetical protein
MIYNEKQKSYSLPLGPEIKVSTPEGGYKPLHFFKIILKTGQ